MAENAAKVEQFLLLAKSAKGLALVDLITKCTSEPGLFTFGEILSLPGVQELEGGQHEAAYDLLQLFAYGTWQDYRAAPAGKYPALSEAQARKLKLLSVVSSADGVRTLAYQDLLVRLELGSVRALEDLLIADCLYGGLLRGKLDQRNKCLHVEDAFCRDVPPDQLAGVAGALDEWLGAANGVLAGIEQRIDWTLDATAAAEQARSEAEKALERERKSIRTTIELQAQADSSGMLMDEQEGFSLADLGDAQDARPGPAAGRHTKRRR
ncbi:hypothetical protein CHLNCDRAFT_137951 [Chlorella variabilis]|uniref:PCI domain-containing protein n=1 Tax=Chlorella variabilis TaxID=554065 RepID=E1Z4X4_CHLVA|nr:hypothetical protein CHLNCDRAFT_137951 [Chlorella variabilis]EFN59423.1 hypothetical protein CHLNCDRAFT_137951 [Chlorella variabilis]|eukprot:XP_005851525.1 hypothetical protein CHLNCDRAFT_137951 [Chlorella variabilis]